MWTRQGRPSFMQRVMEPRVRAVFVLFSPIPAGPVASPFPVTFPPPISPPCLGRPHRAPGRVVHEEDFPLNHILSLFARACVCMLKGGWGVLRGHWGKEDSQTADHLTTQPNANVQILLYINYVPLLLVPLLLATIGSTVLK